jgi:hypothetical protein
MNAIKKTKHQNCTSCGLIKSFPLNAKAKVCQDCVLDPPSLCSVCEPPLAHRSKDGDSRCPDCKELNMTKDSISCVLCFAVYNPTLSSRQVPPSSSDDSEKKDLKDQLNSLQVCDECFTRLKIPATRKPYQYVDGVNYHRKRKRDIWV